MTRLNIVARVALALFVLGLATVNYVNEGNAADWRRRAGEWRDVASIDAHQLDVIVAKCAVDRLTGAAVCGPGTFATLTVTPRTTTTEVWEP